MPFDSSETGTASDKSFELGDDTLELLDLGGGRVKWDRTTVAGQPGDSKQSKPHIIEMHGGFGATHRITRGNGTPSNPAHHAYGENVSAQFEGVIYPAPRIAYIDMSTLVSRARGFRVGGYRNSRVGGSGAGIGATGGGSFNDVPQRFREFGGVIYVHCGRYTFIIDPDQDTPTVTGFRDHSAAGRARSSDIFGNKLGVALGASKNAEWLVGQQSTTIDVIGEDQVEVFDTPGAAIDWVVPENVFEIEADVEGAGGGSSSGGAGGLGARVQTTLPVTPGETLHLRPGGAGPGGSLGSSESGGWNGGGNPGSGDPSIVSPGAGGGATDIRQGGTGTGSRVVVAGGGAGRGASSAAGTGGAPGSAGENGANGSDATGSGPLGLHGTGATGATPGVGGTGGVGTANGSAGTDGDANGQGGNGGGGAGSSGSGGGGGGGYAGGGGGGGGGFTSPNGGSGGGGGAGSSYSAGTGTVFTTGYRSGNGRITLTYHTVSSETSTNASGWSEADLAFDVYRTGVAGKLFAAIGNVVYNVQQGEDPLESTSYLPSNGEVISEVSDPVREIVEYASALVAGTAKGARTLDASRGYYGVPLTEQVRLSSSEYDGRALLAKGPVLYHGTRQGIQMIVVGRPPTPVGPELLHHNQTPYVGMEWGIPETLGDWMAWPAYLPDSGDSVVFLARLRDQEDIGTGPVVWHDVFFLEGRECRSVGLWGGSATRKPRLFFGAGETDNPFQAAWVDLGVGGGPEPFTSDGKPALTGFIESPLDDFGTPGVQKVVERFEFPYLHNADDDNYLTISARAGHDGELTALLTAQEGASTERVTEEGFVRVFAPVDQQLIANELAVRYTFNQDVTATAANWLMIHGTGTLYLTEVPTSIDIIETVLDAKSTDIAEAERYVTTLRDKYEGAHFHQKNGPDGIDRYVRVVGFKATEVEVADSGKRLGIEVSMRQVLV